MALQGVILIIGLIIIIVAALLVFFITQKVFSPTPPPPPQQTCGNGLPCPPEESCSYSGFCIPKGSCAVDRDCPAGICINKTCVTPECQKNEDCAGGLCEKNLCVDKCLNDSQCPGSAICQEGLCLAKKCIIQSDCNFNEACTQTKYPTGNTALDPKFLNGQAQTGFCLAALTNCLTGKDCPGSLNCDNGRCVQCLTNEECGDNRVCLRGLCLHPDQEGCPAGLVKLNAWRHDNPTLNNPVCCPPSCGGNNPQFCNGTADCKNSACPYCVGGVCSCQVAAPFPNPRICSSDKDCSADRYCARGVCAPRSQCTQGTIRDYRCVSSNGSVADGYSCPRGSKIPYCDSITNCCMNSVHNIQCGDTKTCSSVNNYCVNGFCRPQQGSYGDRCTDNRDCQANLICAKNKSIPICQPAQ